MTVDPRKRHALAQLDTVERLLPELMTTLALNVAYAHLLRDAAGVSPEQYEALNFEWRGGTLEQGRVALLRAVNVSRRAYEVMPRNSKERSDVLLAGAAKLGIATDWPGWSEVS